MINNRKNREEKNKGITIVALIVTIIVLLILAGVTLATLSGENGILTKAKTAKEEYKKAQYQEAIDLAKLQAHTEQGKYKIDAEVFLNRVKEILQKNELFKDAPKENENSEAWKIENKVDGDDNKWKLTIITVEDWYYDVTEENTKYNGIGEEIKTVIDKDIKFTYDDTWTQGPILVTIQKVKPEEHEEYKIEYSYDKTTWQDYTTPLPIYKNQFIYAKLTDKGVNVTEPIAQEEITKIDKLKPDHVNIKKEQAIIATDSITIIGEATDAQATKDYGQSGIATYQFSINGEDWVSNKNPLQTSYTFTDLTQNTTYKIKMKVIDQAGNETKTEEIEITTAGIPDLREEDEGSKRANVTFSHDPVGWTNGNVTVTIDTTEEGYTLQYNVGDRNREEDWKNYDSPVVMTENGSIYARLKDNANNKGEAVEHKITTIEREKPTIQIQANTTAISQTKQITITAGDTGGSELLDANYYQYYVSTSATELLNGSWQNYTSGAAFTIGSEITGTRYVWVKQIADNAGNKSEANNGSYHVSSAYEFDNTAPTLTIKADTNNPTNASSITYTFEFSESVTGFTAEDITVTNGTKGTFTAKSTSRYTLVVTNTRDGSQTISVATGKCTDIAGNANKAASKEVTIDRSIPTCTITANVESPTTASSITYTFEWSEMLPNNAFTVEDITVTNGIKGRFLEASKTNTKWTLEVTNTESCSQTISIAAGVVKDGAGNGNVAASKTVVIDRTAPKIEISPNSDTTYTKTKTLGITVRDEHSYIKDVTIEYGWSTSLATPPKSYKTLTYETNNSKINSFTFPLINEGASLTGMYYLWVKPVLLEDILGNSTTTIVKSTGKFYFDNGTPITKLSSNSDTTYSKTKNVTVTIEDGYSGLASGASIKYGWSTSQTTAPTSYTTASISSYTAGTKSISFTATGSGLTGEYYLWVQALELKDMVGNRGYGITSTGTFSFDNSAPYARSVSASDGASKQGNTIVSGNQGTITVSGISDVGGSGVAGYYVSKSSTTPSVTASGWNYLSSSATTFSYNNVTTAGTYYIWLKDNAGNISTMSCVVYVQTAVAQVGSVYYARIQDAIDSISSTGTITMLANTRESTNFPSGKTITLALSGKTITGKSENNGTLRINGTGAIENSRRLYIAK